MTERTTSNSETICKTLPGEIAVVTLTLSVVVSPSAAAANVAAGPEFSSFRKNSCSVPAVMDCVSVSEVNSRLLTVTSPSPGAASEKPGAGGTSTSVPFTVLPPPTTQREIGQRSREPSWFNAFAARPETSITEPPWLGIWNSAGLVTETAPKCQLASAITNKLVESGTIDHPGVTVNVVALLDMICSSCPAPAPLVMRQTSPV